MPIIIHLESIGKHFRNLTHFIPGGFSLTTKQKVVILSVASSVALLGVLAKYMRRKRQIVDPMKLKKQYSRRVRNSGLKSPNGDVVSLASSTRRSGAYYDRISATRQNSVLGVTSEKGSVASGSGMKAIASTCVINEAGDGTRLTPQQLGVMGMEALETSINYWEDALAAYRSQETSGDGALAVLGPEETAFCKDLQQLLESALELQEKSELLFLDERSVLFKAGSGTHPSDPGVETEASGGESFASAQDQVADLREFEEFSDFFADLEQLPLYQSALRQLEEGGIPCRTLRTELVRCGSDGEYLAKLHCLRLAFQLMFKNPSTYLWFADTGRQILAELLMFADKDPKEFIIGYEKMLIFLSEHGNWRILEEELSAKGVKALTFYDVVLDYILMDAFEDLEAPPSSVTAVVQNRWLSNGFKETALTTAVWSVLKAKRRMLKFPNGFMAHFYTLSEQLSPLFAWGFLGPDENLKDICMYFKEQVLGFLSDIFNFQKCKFTTEEELASDVLIHVKKRAENVCRRFYVQA
ncbi:mitoguardin [Agrilus planipennis]|uniref:Mitoguardin n=1 Tax=Agrilus planipennis TaxID=224129 RepID=A0A1W4X9G8_AGRPL|nr:mitoguardin [Agrilus planipennis]